jgi:hypothetical protein
MFLRGLFSKWFFVAYFVLGLIFFVVYPLVVTNVNTQAALFQAVGLMTGSDPFTFREALDNHLGIWVLAWLIHFASWLLIPALIALVVADARDEIKQTQSLDTGFAGMAAELGFPSDEIPGVVEILNDAAARTLQEILRKGESS